VTGPSWLAGTLAATMVAVGVYCAGRLVASRTRARVSEPDVDAAHVAEGVAMAGMLVPRLNFLHAGAWAVVFGLAAAWFAWQSIRVFRKTGAGRAGHYLPHLIEAGAMVLMLLAVAAAQTPGAPGGGMGGLAGGSGRHLVGLIVAVFLLGYTVWTADRITGLPSARSARGGRAVTAQFARPAGASRPRAAPGAQPRWPAGAAGSRAAPGAQPPPALDDPANPAPASSLSELVLSPQLAACCQIALSITMAYMLITMLHV
jgi:hypothetical protein